MARACVIVLDAVGAGELPDAEEYGDVGSDTLGNVVSRRRRARPAEPRGARARQRRAARGLPAAAGGARDRGPARRALEGQGHDHRALGADGRAHADGVPDLPARVPARRDRPVHAPHRPRRARQQGRVGDRDHPGARRGASATGKWIVYTSADSVFQIAAHEETIPLEELYAACRVARDEVLVGKHAVGRVIARPFVGRRGATNGRRTGTTSRSCRSGRTTCRSCATPAATSRASARSATSSRGRTSTTRTRRSPTWRGSRRRSSCCETRSTSALVFANLVETDMLWGHRNDPENFHRCLQDFDRRLPDILDALRPGDLLVLTSDTAATRRRRRQTTRASTRCCSPTSEGRNAAGRVHEGEFSDVGATVQRLAGRQDAARGVPGQPLVLP